MKLFHGVTGVELLVVGCEKETDAVVIKSAYKWIAFVLSLWIALSVMIAMGQGQPDLRDLERRMDRHEATPGHALTLARLDRIEAVVMANSEQLTFIKGGGMTIGGLFILLQMAAIFGVRPVLRRSKDENT